MFAEDRQVAAHVFVEGVLPGKILFQLRQRDRKGGVVQRAGFGNLAEVEGEMFVEIHPDKAAEMNIRNGDQLWIYGTNGARILVPAKISTRVDYNSIWLPQNFSGMDQGESRLENYPEGTKPYAIGESANMISSYGFDYNSACPETKCGLCRIEKAQ